MEEYKAIDNWNNYYVSTNGNVKNKHGLVLSPYDRNGYLHVSLKHNGLKQNMKIHRLVALTFINNPENKETVNHIDGNKKNNHVDNLEWATQRENNLHAYKTKLKKCTTKKPVQQLTLNNKLIKTWDSAREAEVEGFNHSAISCCCRGILHYNTHKNFKWKYLKQKGKIS